MRITFDAVILFAGTIDWLNAVAIPSVLTITLGLYAGLIGTRMFAFFQVRTKAVSWMMRLKEEVFDPEHQSPRGLSNAFERSSREIIIEVRGLGHEKLTRVLQEIFSHHRAAWARLIGIGEISSGIFLFPDEREMERLFAARGLERFGNLLPADATPQATAHFVWRDLMADCREEYLHQISPQLARIASVGPDWCTLLTPLFFPNYISANGGNIGLLMRRPSAWRILLLKMRRIGQRQKSNRSAS